MLCSEEISSLLKYQFVVWAWDMSQAENRQKLYAWMEADMPDVAENVKNIHKSKYPLLIVLIKERGTIMPSAIAKGIIHYLFKNLFYFGGTKKHFLYGHKNFLNKFPVHYFLKDGDFIFKFFAIFNPFLVKISKSYYFCLSLRTQFFCLIIKF